MTLEGFDLSPQQRRLWRSQAGDAGQMRLCRCAVELRGDLDPQRLEEALARLVERHEILRTGFALAPSRLVVQVIADGAAPHWERQDAGARPGAAAGAGSWDGDWAEPFLSAAAASPDLARPPLLSALLVRLPEGCRVLILSLPALCADGQGLLQLAAELGQAYGGTVLAGDVLQYADYAAWMNEQLAERAAPGGGAAPVSVQAARGDGAGDAGDEAGAGAAGGWLAAAAPPQAAARADLAAQKDGGRHGGAVGEGDAGGATGVWRGRWPGARWQAVEEGARAAGVSAEVWVLAAWQALLGRMTRRAGVPVAVLYDGRELEELRSTVGPCARYLVVRGSGASLGETAAALGRELAAQAGAAGSLAWEGDVAMPGAAVRAPAGAYGFEWMLQPPAWRSGGVEGRVVRLSVRVERFALALSCWLSAEGLRLELLYDPARCERLAVGRLGEQLGVLAGAASAAPAAPIGELPLLGAAARHQVVHAFNEMAPPAFTVPLQYFLGVPGLPGLLGLPGRQAAATPATVAVEHAGGCLTYGELAVRAGALAARLRLLGVGPEVVVGVLLERSPEMVIALLALLAAGGAYLPLDPQLPAERLGYMIEDSGAALVLSHRELSHLLPPGGPPLLRLGPFGELEAPAGLSPEALVPPVTAAELAPAALVPELAPAVAAVELAPAQLAYVIYTSGSTGRPKGALISRGALANYLAWSAGTYVGRGGGAPLHSPLAFDLSVTALFVPLLRGRRVRLVDEAAGLDGLAAALGDGFEHSFVKLTPAHMQLLRTQLDDATGVSCEALVLGGEALLGAHVAWWRERWPATRLYNEYGPTEATVGCCVHELGSADGGAGPLPIGRPIAGLRLHVVDEHMQPLPVGVTGELLLGGAGLARGYLRRPALTAERFVPDPFAAEAGQRLYRTGDLARYRADGTLECLGRRDRQVKIRGFRVELGEIEQTLRRHPAVRDAVALVDETQAGAARLCACWSGDAAGDEDLIAWLGERLPAYMVPQVVVGPERLPLTANGKVDAAAALALIRQREAAQRRPYRAPRTPAEQVLAAIWAELLGVERVGLDDHFFQLGGDSIMSLQVLGRAGRHGIQIMARQIVEHPTLAALAAVAKAATPRRSEAGPVSGPVPLLPIQHAFFAVPDPTPQHYNLALLLAVRRPLTAAALAAAAAAVWGHHDALRLRFHRTGEDGDGSWRQEIPAGADPVPFSVLDLAALPAAVRSRAQAAAGEQMAAGFDLAGGRLARFAFFATSGEPPEERGRLLVLLHHLVADVVSLRILLEDLATAGQQAAAGKPLALPPKSTSYRRWSEELRRHADSAELRAEADFWLAPRWRRAVPLPHEAVAQPADGMPRRRPAAGAATCGRDLDAGSTRALAREAPIAFHADVRDVLVSALAVVLTGWSAGPVRLDLEGHGREALSPDLDLSRTVGWFTTLFPVLLEAPPAADPRQALRAAKEELRRLPGNGLGYGVLRHLGSDGEVRRALAAMPPAEIALNYLGQLGPLSPLDPMDSLDHPGQADRLGLSGPAAAGRPEAGAALLAPTAGPTGAPQGPRRERPHGIEVVAFIAGGRLRMEWSYDRGTYSRNAIEGLAGRLCEQLRLLAAACLAPRAAAYSPADFPLARLTPALLDELTARHGRIEDVYPLAPIQESMLLHSLAFPASDVGFEQTAIRLGPALDPAGAVDAVDPVDAVGSVDAAAAIDAGALRRDWRRLAARHPVLRTCFAWQGMASPLQIVVPVAEARWAAIDLSAVPAAMRSECQRAALAADRARGFDLARPPLMRFLLIRLGEDGSFLVWSRHHLLLDGWSTAIVLGELATLAKGGRGERHRHDARTGRDEHPERADRRDGAAALAPCRPYRDYIAWLAGQDTARTEQYWRRLLAGISAPTPLGPLGTERFSLRGRQAVRPRHAGNQRVLPAAVSAAMRRLAGAESFTTNILLQGAWACLLARYSGEPEVVFGNTVSGRPAELAGVESMVGLFIKNLPVRIRCAPGAAGMDLLRAVQRAQLDLREHEAASPADVQAWSEVPGSLPLYETLVVFENYPVTGGLVQEWEAAAPAAASAAAVRTAYPLTLVAAQAERLVLLLVHHRARCEDTAAKRLLGHLESLLAGLAADPSIPLGELPLLSAAERHQLVHEWAEGRPPEQGWLVLDPQRQPVPVDVAGELWAAGQDGQPRRPTGEAARPLHDGRIERLGRLDRMVRVQGRLVDPQRLEELLAEHPAVGAVAVVAIATAAILATPANPATAATVALPGAAAAAGSPGPLQLIAYVEPRGAAPDAGTLRAFLRAGAGAAPLPASFVFLRPLPRRADGTVDRRALPSPAAATQAAELADQLLGMEGDLLETQLARLWEDLLCKRPVSPEDDFFALGGTSFTALRLASRVRRELGRDLPLAALEGAPTVRALAARLRAGIEAARWSPLVAMRPAGTRLPFFCVHPVGGNVLCLAELARCLDPARPFYALQAAGLGPGDPPQDDMAAMAAHYVAEIRRVQPAGPYLLGGLSFGGYVAFEMGWVLHEMGEEVSLVALLDTASPRYRGRPTFHADGETALAVQAGFIARASGGELAIDAADLRPLGRAAQVDAVVERLLPVVTPTHGLGEEHLRRLLALYQAHALALQGWKPRVHAGRLAVLRAREEHRTLEALLDHPAQHEPDYGWSELSRQPVETRVVAGDHSTMICRPQVATLALELEAALAGADAGAPAPVALAEVASRG